MNVYDLIIANKPSGQAINVEDFSAVIIYGVGRLGKKLYAELSALGVQVAGFMDRNADAISFTNKIYSLLEAETALDKSIPVIISVSLDKKNDALVRENLKKIGFKSIYSLYELDWNKLFDTALGKDIFIGNYSIDKLQEDIDDISCAYNLLAEDYDRTIFLKCISAYLHKNFTDLSCYAFEQEYQYLGHGIEKEIDFRRTIDCGAYDGDVLRNLLAKGRSIEAYLAIEPQMDLCVSIMMMSKGAVDVDISVLPCGVGNKIEQKFFWGGGEAKLSARIADSGEDVIQCITIDMIGDVFKPTFIKMDIEGMEPFALEGAKNTIKKYKPILAICVYHDVSHLWKISQMISEMNDSYKFYLRSYWFMGMETVLYAFPE